MAVSKMLNNVYVALSCWVFNILLRFVTLLKVFQGRVEMK